MKRHIAHRLLAAALPLAVLVAPVPAAAAMPVFDATNYAQNLLQAARALEQINHQIASLQNEAAMLQNMARNLQRIDFPQLQQMNAALGRIDRLMGNAEAIGFEPGDTGTRLRALFPAEVDAALKGDIRAQKARARLQSAMESYKHSMSVQSEVVSNIGEDSRLLGELIGRSQDAAGALQAQQATNQLLALSAKQQLQLQNLVAAEYRSQAIERSRRLQSEVEAAAATRRFLGSGKAYSRHAE